jgi:metal-responsive CopG/Arc/MetJ family transcriptional regulator
MENLDTFKKVKRKKTSTFTIDKEVLEKFDKLAKDNGLNKSKVVEKLIEDFIKQFEKSN